MEQQCTQACEKQCDLDGETLSVEIAVDQDGHEDRRAEHGEQVLNAEDRHLGVTEF